MIWSAPVAAAVLVMLIGLVWGAQLWSRHDRDLANGELLVASLARASEASVDGTIRGVEFLLEETAGRLNHSNELGPADTEWLRARLTGLPEIRGIIIAGADGLVSAPMIEKGPPQPLPAAISIADRDYFQKIKASFPQQRFQIATPVSSRFSEDITIPLVYALADAQGAFAGIITAGLAPSVLRDHIAPMVIEEQGGAAVFRDDAVILARIPGHDQFLGKVFPDTPIFQQELPKRRAGVSRFVAPTDGNDKVIAFRALSRYPLVVTVGMTRDTILTAWRHEALSQALALGILATALMTAALLYHRRAVAARLLTRQLAESHATLEEQVELRTAHLAAANAELEHFAYAASHDLQEPLRNIISFLQLLARRYHGRLDSEADEFIDFAVRGAKQMSALVSDVLTYSSAGQRDTPPEACDLNHVTRAALAALASARQEAGGQVTIQPLPTVQGWPVLLHSLFQNLIANALKYRAADRAPQVVISARAAEQPGMVEISVADNGIGVDAAYLENIFGLFQRLHSRERYEGTGIGLALCRKIVERHGGRIWAESQPGTGTTLRFTLPEESRTKDH